MGAAVGRRLTEYGVQVLTTLGGRSAASEARALKAGMTPVSADRLADADLILSIVPPGEAVSFAEELAPALTQTARKPVFVDCNAVSPETVLHIGSIVEATGTPFVDSGIIGPPPGSPLSEPSFYASGPHAARFAVLAEHGLDIRVLKGPIGAASALKMCFAGIAKGYTAVATAMTIAAMRVGAADALHAELAAREPAALAALNRKVPDMIPKAYRWVAEMEEIAKFLVPDGTGEIFEGAAAVYSRIAEALASGDADIEQLRSFYAAAESR
jgi:putative dehydrogenase